MFGGIVRKNYCGFTFRSSKNEIVEKLKIRKKKCICFSKYGNFPLFTNNFNIRNMWKLFFEKQEITLFRKNKSYKIPLPVFFFLLSLF